MDCFASQCKPRRETSKCRTHNQEHNWLRYQEAQGPTEILRDQFPEVYFDFFLFSMYAPVERPPTEFGCLVDEHDRRVRLREEEQIQTKG